MPFTLTEKILARASGRASVSPGENVWVRADVLLTHDVCGPPTFGIFEREFGKDARVWDPDRIAVIPDHYVFTEDPKARENIEVLARFAARQKLPHYYAPGTARYQGVCHCVLPAEGFVRPGEVIFGTDSHTCTHGAFGAFATGIGNTEAAFILGTGKLWLRVPETMRFIFRGRMPPYLMAKDLILRILGDIGADGANYAAMEFSGEAVESLSVDEQMTICNMAVEAGAKNGVVPPNPATLEYVRARTKKPFEPLWPDPGSKAASTREYDAAQLVPVVARPHSPDAVVPARDLAGTAIDSVYIGSCTGGKTADFEAAARILKGRTVKVLTLAVPATKDVEAEIRKPAAGGGKSVFEILVAAGVRFSEPSCAACLGGPLDTFGRIHARERRVATTNRNFPGRMGSKLGEIYLASPQTAAASAVTGKITDPRDVP